MVVAFTGFLGSEWTATVTGDVTASNFDGGALPDSGMDVVVGGTELGRVANISNSTYQNYPLLPVAAHNLEVLAGGTVNANASQMTIHGALVNKGSFNINTDSVKVLGDIVNDGLLTIDADHNASHLLMDSGDFKLEGGGNLRLASETDGTAYLTGRDGALTVLTNQSRISGTGYIGWSGQIYYPGGPVAIHNEGIIDANASGRDLVIVQGTTAANPMLNNGSLVANGNGRLIIDQAYLQQGQAGVIGAYGAGSVVTLADVVVRGGLLDSSGGGAIELEYGSGYGADGSYNGTLLDGSTDDGAVTITAAGRVHIGVAGGIGQQGSLKGAIINHGAIGISGYASDLAIAEGGATLTGGGDILLSYTAGAGANDGDAKLTAAAGAASAVLTNVDNLIHGAGFIGRYGYTGYTDRQLSVVNTAGGIIEADNAGYALVINQTVRFDNSGILRSTDGATMRIGINTGTPSEITAIDNDDGRIVADGNGSVVQLLAATIRGGAIEATNGGVVQLLNGAYSVLDGSTSEGTVTIEDSIEVGNGMIRGQIVNNGAIGFDIRADARLLIAKEGATIAGGVVELATSSAGSAMILGEDNTKQALLVNAGTIEGGGYIGTTPSGPTGLLLLRNAANGTIRATAGETLIIDTDGTIVNNGLLQADGGVLDISDAISGNGSLSATHGGTMKLRDDWTGTVNFQGNGVETLTRNNGASGWGAGGVLTLTGFAVGDRLDLGYVGALALATPNAFGWTQSGSGGTMHYDLNLNETRDFLFSGLTQTHLELIDNGSGGLAIVGRAVTEGRAKADVFKGTAGDDRIVGYGGNDLFRGSAGNDIFDGGDGKDTVSYASAKAQVSVLLDDGDLGQTIGAGQGSDIFRSIENVIGSNFADSLSGDAANNDLSGGKGKDILIGNAGNDRLTGGADADTLTGGEGADIFIYLDARDSTAKSKGRDTISNFSRADRDKIDLSEIDANIKANGDQDFTFIKSKDFSGKAGQLRFEKLDAQSFLYGDTDGDREADFAIQFDSAIAFKAGDFML